MSVVELWCLRHAESENVVAPLPPAVPFAVRWDGTRWECPAWPA